MVTDPEKALVFGLFSALSLPMGAVIGLVCAPVPERITARFMAFGSGALVFAVATQLYGETITELEAIADKNYKVHAHRDRLKEQHFRNLVVQVVFGFLGALLYTLLNKVLERCAAGGQAAPAASPARHEEEAAARRPGPVELQGAVDTGASGPSTWAPSTLAADDVSPSLRSSGGFGAGASACRSWPATQQGGASCKATPDAAPAGTGGSWHAGTTLELAEPLAASNGLARSGDLLHVSHHEMRMPAPLPEAGGHGQRVALSMWLGVTLDGIPEALMLGFMTNKGSLSWNMLVAVFIANFPEAFSAASLLRGYHVPARKIVGMWTMVFLLTGGLAMLGSAIMPSSDADRTLERIADVGTAACEGLTGGAMLAMVSTAMVPEAYHHAGGTAGILFVVGFMLSVWLDGIGLRYGKPQHVIGR